MSSHAAEKSKFFQICSLIMEQSHPTLLNKMRSGVTGHDWELDVITYKMTEEDMTSPPQRTHKQQREMFSVLINIQLSFSLTFHNVNMTFVCLLSDLLLPENIIWPHINWDS